MRSYRIDGELRESPLDPVPVSDSKYVRIERGLYRFEIFSRVFCKPPSVEAGTELLGRYSDFFAPQEHEQLASLRDSITRILLSRSYYLYIITTCRTLVTESRAEYHHRNGPGVVISRQMTIIANLPGFVKDNIPRGLAHIQDVVEGATHWEPQTVGGGIISATLLYDHLKFSVPDDPTLLGVVTEDKDLQDQYGINITPWYPDTDLGAGKTWRRPYHMEPIKNCVDSLRQEPLRAWGYVF